MEQATAMMNKDDRVEGRCIVVDGEGHSSFHPSAIFVLPMDALEAQAIEQFTALGKTAHAKAAMALVAQATSHPNLFVFGEILELPNIAELASLPDGKPWHDLLRLFAYGTYHDYLQNEQALPQISEGQLRKLKTLTLIGVASQHKILPYDLLLEQLGMPDVRELEDLIIEAIYTGLIRGKLDQKSRHLEVHYSRGRDVQPERVPELMNTLQHWCENSERLLREIRTKADDVATAQEQHREYQRNLSAKVAGIRTAVRAQESMMPLGEFDSLDHYREEEARRGKGRPRMRTMEYMQDAERRR